MLFFDEIFDLYEIYLYVCPVSTFYGLTVINNCKSPKRMIRITTLLAVFCIILTSCSTDIEINDPALQAKIDGQLFRSTFKKAVIHDDGTLVISGSEGNQSISFTTSSTKTGTYKLAQQTLSRISFEKDQTKFTSQDDTTEGEVVITEIHNNEISGNFYFKNLNDTKGNTTSMESGWFYRVPIENAVAEEPTVEINPCLLNASLTALIDGSEMITDNHTAELFGVSSVSILIKATNEDGEITIVLPATTSPGEYSLTGSGDYSATYTAGTDKSSALSGRLIITDHDIDTKCIGGSFEFETRSGIQVTEGLFDFGY
ncbi:hypothetical protein D1816_19705 [Aquimarina sp. AD10]|nr:hypothetical protein D1816_19705 [Aquimarina sp. AD10]RKM90317.1 hypothetical protein D7033_22705 [Aquimarina sp. AD10]